MSTCERRSAARTFWFREGCVKIMQMRTEFEIKAGLITPVLSIWLHLGGGVVNHLLPTTTKKRTAASGTARCALLLHSFKKAVSLV